MSTISYTRIFQFSYTSFVDYIYIHIYSIWNTCAFELVYFTAVMINQVIIGGERYSSHKLLVGGGPAILRAVMWSNATCPCWTQLLSHNLSRFLKIHLLARIQRLVWYVYELNLPISQSISDRGLTSKKWHFHLPTFLMRPGKKIGQLRISSSSGRHQVVIQSDARI
jgi:hypothetical protein